MPADDKRIKIKLFGKTYTTDDILDILLGMDRKSRKPRQRINDTGFEPSFSIAKIIPLIIGATIIAVIGVSVIIPTIEYNSELMANSNTDYSRIYGSFTGFLPIFITIGSILLILPLIKNLMDI